MIGGDHRVQGREWMHDQDVVIRVRGHEDEVTGTETVAAAERGGQHEVGLGSHRERAGGVAMYDDGPADQGDVQAVPGCPAEGVDGGPVGHPAVRIEPAHAVDERPGAGPFQQFADRELGAPAREKPAAEATGEGGRNQWGDLALSHTDHPRKGRTALPRTGERRDWLGGELIATGRFPANRCPRPDCTLFTRCALDP